MEDQKISRQPIHNLLIRILKEILMSNNRKEPTAIILHKKGDRAIIKNYRPIPLLSIIYKLFTKIVTKRLTTKLDGYQPKEPAGFRKGFCTMVHLLSMKILIERANVYSF